MQQDASAQVSQASSVAGSGKQTLQTLSALPVVSQPATRELIVSVLQLTVPVAEMQP